MTLPYFDLLRGDFKSCSDIMTQANGYVKAQTGPKNMDGDGSKAIGTSSQELTFQGAFGARGLGVLIEVSISLLSFSF